MSFDHQNEMLVLPYVQVMVFLSVSYSQTVTQDDP